MITPFRLWHAALPLSLGLWMFASVHPVDAQQGTLRPGSTLYRIQGREPGDALGQDFAVLGDVDGDGINDFATSGSSTLCSTSAGNTTRAALTVR